MRSLRAILFQPLLIAALTLLGLIAALVSDGAGDVTGWLCLGYIVLLAVRHCFTRTERQ